VWACEGDLDPGSVRSNTFEMEWPPKSGTSRSFPEVDRAEWFPPDVAKKKLSVSQAVSLIGCWNTSASKAAEAPRVMTRRKEITPQYPVHRSSSS